MNADLFPADEVLSFPGTAVAVLTGISGDDQITDHSHIDTHVNGNTATVSNSNDSNLSQAKDEQSIASGVPSSCGVSVHSDSPSKTASESSLATHLNTNTQSTSSVASNNAVTTSKSGLRLKTLEPSSSTVSHVPSVVNVHNNANYNANSSNSSSATRFVTAATPVTSATSAVPSRIPHEMQSLPIAIKRKRNNSISQNRFDDDNVSIVSASSLATSFSKNFLFGFLNNKQKDGNKASGLISKEYWMKDETSTECFICGALFTTFRRKHHCRICGQIFCSKCTLLIPGEKFNYNGKMRVCKSCVSFANDYNDDTSDESSVEDNYSHHDNEPLQDSFEVGTPKSQLIQHTDSSNHFPIANASSSKFGGLDNFHDQHHHNNHNHDSQQSHHVHHQSHFPNHRHTHSFSQHNENAGKPFFPTPPTPPPRMAIPATRKGESVEIPAVAKSFNSRISSIHNAGGGGSSNTIGNVKSRRLTFDKQNTPINNNGGSQFPYFVRGFDQGSNNNIRPDLTRQSSLSSLDGHFLTGSNMKNMSHDNEEAVLESPIGDQRKGDPYGNDSGSEDEGSMSLYAAFYLDPPYNHSQSIADNSKDQIGNQSTRQNRNNTRSLERAQASLIRMKNRRKSKSYHNKNALSLYDNNVLNGSPNQSHAQLDSSHGSANRNFFYDGGGQDRRADEANISRSSPAASPLAKSVKPRPNKTELSDVCVKHMSNILHQDLTLEEVPDINKWEEIIILLLQDVENVQYDVKSGDNIDIRQYVKLKRLQGGKPEDTQIVDGTVFCKTLALKGMPRHINNPRIALIMFPLEYMRSGQQHFMSLEPVLAQENEFIKKLVGRIIALQPDVVFVGANVSGIALRLLYEAGIVVSYNVKPQVIERIARLTQADIVISMDKLVTNLKLGSCSALNVQTYAYGNSTKTLISLTGCDLRLGFTVLIRGGDNLLLRKIKGSIEFMVYAVGHLKCETAFYHDNIIYSSPDAYSRMLDDFQAELACDDRVGIEFLREFRARLLSISPIVKFDVPYLLSKARDFQNLVAEARLDYDKIESDPAVLSHYMDQLGIQITDLFGAEEEAKQIARCVLEKRVSSLEERFRLKSTQWEFFCCGAVGMLDISYHQNIIVLHSIVNTKTAMPCVSPYTLKIDFYWTNDVTLGRYIEQLIHTSNNLCSENCGATMGDHYRTYVHGNAKIDIMVERSVAKPPTIANKIFIWGYCKVCGFTSPFTPLSDSSWKMSFGKFLELMFWSQRDSVTNLGTHTHDWAKDNIKFFTYNDMTIRMDYSKIDLLDIIPPTAKTNWIPKTDIKLKISLRQQVTEKCQNFFNSVSERLNRVKVDSISNDKMEAGHRRIEELKERVLTEQQTMISSIEEIYNNTAPIDHLPLNSVLRYVQDLSVSWDTEFTQFEQDYLPTEKDIARITALQLKKLFGDEKEKVGAGDHEKEERHTVQVETETLETKEEGSGVSVTTTSTTTPVASAVTATASQAPVALTTVNSSRSTTPVPTGSATAPGGPDILQSTSTAITDKESNSDPVRQGIATAVLHEPASSSTEPPTPKSPTELQHHQPPVSSTVRKVSDSSTNSEAYLPKINAKGKVLEGINKFEKLVSEQEQELIKSSSIGNIDLKSVAKLPLLPSVSPLVTTPKVPSSLSATTPLHTPKAALTPNLTPMKNRLTPEQPKIMSAMSPAFERHDSSYFDRDAFSSNFVGPKFGISTKDLEIQLKEGRQRSFSSLTSNGGGGGLKEDSKVSKLTNYFDHLDNLSREFELAREKERLKLSHNRYRAAPVASSRPIVEVFENVNDAFKEELQKSVAGKGIAAKPSTAAFSVNSAVSKSKSVANAAANATAAAAATSKACDSSTTGEDGDKIKEAKEQPHKEESAKMPQTERVSLMKTLTNFWADRSATLWKPLEYPLSSSEHAFVDSDVIIREDEPSSLIAFSLSTNDYIQKITDFNQEHQDFERLMTTKKAIHLKYQFNEGSTILSCKIFFAVQFDAFRRKCGLEDNFIQSLSRCVKWDSSGGKSGSAFLKTLDDRLVMKQLSTAELDSFVQFAPAYFDYMSQALFHDLPTTLAKIFGFYQVHIKNPITGKNFKMDVLIMENLFYGKKNLRIFDLKGSMRNRHVEKTGKENEVLLDENMVEYIYESPLFVREFDKKLLTGSLWNDTIFLAKMNIMDYSLVIGIDDTSKTLTVGIIDFIRTFTWDKKLESWVKEKGLVGGGGGTGPGKEPTIITPREYKNRFREAMGRYFLMVPDTWFQESGWGYTGR